MHIDRAQQTRDSRDGVVVTGGKIAGNHGKAEGFRIKALAGSRKCSLADVRCSAAGCVKGHTIRRNVVMDETIVGAKLQGVFTLYPGKVVDEVVHWNVQESGGILRCQRADIGESHHSPERSSAQLRRRLYLGKG